MPSCVRPAVRSHRPLVWPVLSLSTPLTLQFQSSCREVNNRVSKEEQELLFSPLCKTHKHTPGLSDAQVTVQ